MENGKREDTVQPLEPGFVGVLVDDIPVLVQDGTVDKPRRCRGEDKLDDD